MTAWGFSGLSSFFWAAVASRDGLFAQNKGCSSSIALFVGCDLLFQFTVVSRSISLGNKHFVLI